uniref:sorting nexin-30-like n=1 Tax=Styela clava TaxID=7725 RepID=UPI00193A03C9|nr:sorting nexin-30-like [Styela clava]
MTEFLDPLSQAAAANSDESDDEIPRKETELAEKQEITEVDDGDLFDEEGKTEQQELDDDDIIDLVNDGSLAKIKNESMSNNRSLSTEFDDQKDLFVTVEKPEKIILSMETYISYQVSTKTTRSTFDDSEYKVRRRYQDFIWLRGKLEEAHPTHLIPPLPSKFIVKGMVDRFSSEFVGTRCRALDSFLKRIAEHPVISFSDHVTVFLTSEDFADHRKQNKPGLLSRVGGTVKSAATVGSSIRSRGRDPEFAEMSDHVATFREQMAVTDRVAERLLNEEKELVNELKEYAPTYSAWASTENQVLAPIITSVSKCVDSCAEWARKNAEDHELYFIPPLKEYMLYCDGIEQVFKRRDVMQNQRDKCHEELKRKREEKDNLPASDQSYSLSAMLGKKPDEVKQQKQEKLEQQIEELTKRYEELSDLLEKSNADLKSDMERWKFNKKQDMKQIFTQLAESHITYQSQCLSSWESLVPLMQGKVDFGDLGQTDNDLVEEDSENLETSKTSISNDSTDP